MKRVLRNDLIIDEDILEFLQDMNDQGYKLVKKNIFWVFEETDEKLKYQIDYNEPTEEYLDILNNLGYRLVCFNDEMKIYENENTEAENLVSDYEYLDKARTVPYLLFLIPVAAVLILIYAIKCYSVDLMFNLGDFYIHNLLYFVFIYLVLIIVYGMIGFFRFFSMNCYYEGNSRYIKYYKLVNNINIVISIAMLLLSFMYLIIQHNFIYNFALAGFGIFIALLTGASATGYILVKNKKQLSKIGTVMKAFPILLGIIAVTLNPNFSTGLDSTEGYFPDNFPVLSGEYYDEYKNIFLDDYSTQVDPVFINDKVSWLCHHYIICDSEDIAKKVFEREIIYEQYLKSAEAKENTTYLSYSNALKEYTKADHCYVLDDVVICQYKNMVVCLQNGDTKSIEQFIDFYNQQSY